MARGNAREGLAVVLASIIGISRHTTQAAAIDAGRREAKRDGVDLVTHGCGPIRSKDSYGKNPLPPCERER